RRRPVLALSITFAAVLLLAFSLNVFSVRDKVAGIVSPRVESIAVLPLVNDSGDPRQEYLSDGLTDQLITELSHFSGLKNVVPRTTIMTYKDSTKNAADIGRELNVQRLIEGSVQRIEDRVKV